jgi:hypothetical protein
MPSVLDVFPAGVLPPAESTLLIGKGSSDRRFSLQSTSDRVAQLT